MADAPQRAWGWSWARESVSPRLGTARGGRSQASPSGAASRTGIRIVTGCGAVVLPRPGPPRRPGAVHWGRAWLHPLQGALRNGNRAIRAHAADAVIPEVRSSARGSLILTGQMANALIMKLWSHYERHMQLAVVRPWTSSLGGSASIEGAQFMAVCSSSRLAETLGYAGAFLSPWRGKRCVFERRKPLLMEQPAFRRAFSSLSHF
jgi:hypothetical protein